MDDRVERELDGGDYPDNRLKTRLAKLLGDLGRRIGATVPMACQDWAATKAAYRFFSNQRVDEGLILAGHFAATKARFAGTTGPTLVLHDTTEFSFTRENPEAIGQISIIKGRHGSHTICGVLLHSSLVLTTQGVPLGLAAVKFWTRKKFRLSRKICGSVSGLRAKRSHPGAPLGHDGVTTLRQDRECPRMRLQTILNRVEKFKSFTYGDAHFEDHAGGPALIVQVLHRTNSRPYCSGCLRRGQPYDLLKERRFEFVPLRGILVFLAYRMRRVDCPRCGVTVEIVPWSDGKNRLTTTYRWYLAGWARRLSWGEVGAIFRTSWDSVCRSVEQAVEWGLAHRDLSRVTAVGIDEVAWQRGHTYMTLVYDIGSGAKRLLAVAEHRTEASLRSCLDGLGKEFCPRIKFVCSDMWQPYLKVIGERLGGAIHVLDRFHIIKQFGKALDEIRAEESKRLKRDGYEPVLKKSRWCLLKRPANLTEKQTVKLSELLRYNLRTMRAYLLREDFQRFWEYRGPVWAGKFLDEWTRRVMRSRLEPMKKVARTLRNHRPLILNWFRAKGEVSSGAVEGLNNKVKLVTRKSYGFRTAKVARLALLHNLGRLPEPERTHKFC